ncbi:MAG TPA: Ldh family oxidoreductase [Candidatus Methylomirabilis sp.]|nr:Ldh family oxidoreductase [Candidatus Methylomirabilis sp.]
MHEVSPGRVRLSVPEACGLAEHALCRIGYDADEARIIADHVIDAALCGYEYSGLAKILNIPEHRRFKQPRRPMSVLHQTEVSTLFDGGNNVGMLAMYHAARAAIEKGCARGFALIGVTNSWVSGRSAYYVEMIAKADLIGIHTVSAARMVAPFGGIRPALGTNPIAFGMPSSRGPVVFDMGTSAIMATDLLLRERLGQLLPEGAALDPQGRPTRDPTQAKLGALLPFGGYKGFGLAFIMQAFGVLAGSGLDLEKDNGYVFVAFKPDLLIPLADFKRQLSELIERVKSTPRLPGVEEIRIPSERAFRERKRNLRTGIEIDRRVYDALSAF